MSGSALTKEFEIINSLGVHARPASLFVQCASGFSADIQVLNLDSGVQADGKSLMSMLMLAAGKGVKLRLTVQGGDAPEAMRALGELILSGFHEE